MAQNRLRPFHIRIKEHVVKTSLYCAFEISPREEAWRVRGLAEPDFGCRRMLRADARHQLQTARLRGVAVLVAFPGDQRPVVRGHLKLPVMRLNRAARHSHTP